MLKESACIYFAALNNKSRLNMKSMLFILPLLFLFSCQTKNGIERIALDNKGTAFVKEDSDTEFRIKGVNYDRDWKHRLIEDYWHDEWQTVVEDFQEMKELGINAVRIHLQINKFIPEPNQVDPKEINKLKDLIALAEEKKIYLNITGLACYHAKKVPKWYHGQTEEERWNTQAFFWQQIAKVCRNSNIIFCYDLMNEPVVQGGKKNSEEWLGGELAGKSYVQKITRTPNGRSSKQIAKSWVLKLTSAIREIDDRHLITVGVIPWVQIFPKAKPLFYSPEVAQHLDFVSVHFYPKKGKVREAITALKAYDIRKPIVIEETFPLSCTIDEFKIFMKSTQTMQSGFFSFYWGKTALEYESEKDKTSFIMIPYLEFLKEHSP